jgi:circadian clock protein KaiC
MIERLSSGQASIDEILGGGLPSPAINLVAGAPGSGKTMLAQQYAFTNGTIERPAIYLATTSEPLDKLVRYGQELSFFDASKVGSAVFYDSLLEPLASGGLQGVIERVIELLRDVRPGSSCSTRSSRSGRSAPTSTATASSSRSWPDASRPPRRARSGSC